MLIYTIQNALLGAFQTTSLVLWFPVAKLPMSSHDFLPLRSGDDAC